MLAGQILRNRDEGLTSVRRHALERIQQCLLLWREQDLASAVERFDQRRNVPFVRGAEDDTWVFAGDLSEA